MMLVVIYALAGIGGAVGAFSLARALGQQDALSLLAWGLLGGNLAVMTVAVLVAVRRLVRRDD
jgi:hypothetical protein